MENKQDKLPQERINPELNKFASIRLVLNLFLIISYFLILPLSYLWKLSDSLWVLGLFVFLVLLFSLIFYLEKSEEYLLIVSLTIPKFD